MNHFAEVGDVLVKLKKLAVAGPAALRREQLVQEALAEHADGLLSGRADRVRVGVDRVDDELATLLPLAGRVHEALHPVSPAPGYRERLLSDLMRRAQAEGAVSPPSIWEGKRKEILIGALITSLVSAVGLLAYLLGFNPFHRRPHAGPIVR